MQYTLLPWIIEQEGSDFQVVQNHWRPAHLLFIQQMRVMLQDMKRRYQQLEAARSELQTLERAERYIKLLNRMRLWLRQAFYSWKANQLAFLQATAGFYSDYGVVLRFLKFDQMRGRFASPAAEGV